MVGFMSRRILGVWEDTESRGARMVMPVVSDSLPVVFSLPLFSAWAEAARRRRGRKRYFFIVTFSSLFDVRFLQTIAFQFVFQEEEKGDDDGDNSEAGEDGHGLRVVDGAVGSGVGLVHFSNPDGDECESDVLDVEDESVGCAEEFHRNDFGTFILSSLILLIMIFYNISAEFAI